MNNYNIKSSFVRKRGNNYNVYVEYIDENNNLKQKSLGKYSNKKDAEKHLIDLKSSINNNKFIVPKDITLVDRCIKFVNDHKEQMSINTIKSRKTCIRDIQEFFKDTKLNEVTIYQAQTFCNELCKKYKLSTVKNRVGFLNTVLKEAYRMREINENIASFIEIKKKEAKFKSEVFDKEEIKKIVTLLEGNVIELPILLMMTMGLRYGEACGLRWCDIDFINNTISIEKNLIYTKETGFILKDPKTFESKRKLTAPPQLMSKFKKEHLRQKKLKLQGVLENELDLVCLNDYLHYWHNANLRKAFLKLLDIANIKHIRLHDLRHTNATMQLAAGVSIKVMSKRLGHTDIKTSLNVYSHVLDEMDKDASDKIADVMFK
ncbi:MAG: site-specific integrase [Romboutsia timonensis]|uniref:site-specific integrase n=1 Tax=Romboutsia timonensis TaxID=1776391 RepID=UPI002A74C285|nr:site-specific integrase [Romboutsia timonensis]MCI6667584.1 site-specific integrase [Romboutsia timonensis]MDY3000895.1 site-specific integrase [Romboutsia timonensis]